MVYNQGVKQGDALGPLLFTLVLMRPLKRTAEQQPLARITAYFDDVIIVDKPEYTTPAYKTLITDVNAVGLTAVCDKSSLHGGNHAIALAASAELGSSTSLSGLLWQAPPIDTVAFINDFINSKGVNTRHELQKSYLTPFPPPRKIDHPHQIPAAQTPTPCQNYPASKSITPSPTSRTGPLSSSFGHHRPARRFSRRHCNRSCVHATPPAPPRCRIRHP
jgi:hypothetical protein